MAAAGVDPEGGPVSFAWDLDRDGTFETPGQSVPFSAAALDGPSTRTIAVRATDAGGLAASAEATVTVANVAPTVAAPAVSAEPSTPGAAVAARAAFIDPAPDDAPFTCTVDYGDGSGPLPGTVAAGDCTGPSHAYGQVGSYLVTVRVTDKDGGTGGSSVTHAVVYAFSGFFPPVDDLPVLNSVRGGRSVPVKFSLAGDQGLSIIAAGYPLSGRITCDASAPVDGIEETVAAGGSSLSYDPATDTYTYAWKTEQSWSGTCRQFVVRLDDGTVHRASFLFT